MKIRKILPNFEKGKQFLQLRIHLEKQTGLEQHVSANGYS